MSVCVCVCIEGGPRDRLIFAGFRGDRYRMLWFCFSGLEPLRRTFGRPVLYSEVPLVIRIGN